MVDAGLYVAEAFDGERISFGEYALGAIVLIFTIFIFKVYGVARRNYLHVNAHLTQFVDGSHVSGSEGRNELKVLAPIEVIHCVGKVVGCAARQVGLGMRCDNFIVCNMSDATNVVHRVVSCNFECSVQSYTF